VTTTLIIILFALLWYQNNINNNLLLSPDGEKDKYYADIIIHTEQYINKCIIKSCYST